MLILRGMLLSESNIFLETYVDIDNVAKLRHLFTEQRITTYDVPGKWPDLTSKWFRCQNTGLNRRSRRPNFSSLSQTSPWQSWKPVRGGTSFGRGGLTTPPPPFQQVEGREIPQQLSGCENMLNNNFDSWKETVYLLNMLFFLRWQFCSLGCRKP